MEARTKALKKIAALLEGCKAEGISAPYTRKDMGQSLERAVDECGRKGYLTRRDSRIFQAYAADLLEQGGKDPLTRLNALVKLWINNPLLQPVRYAVGVGPAREKILAGLGIESIADLLTYYPRRYEDRSRMKPVGELKNGELATVQGVVESMGEQRLKGGRLRLLKVAVSDGRDRIFAVWFNQSYLKRSLRPGQEVLISGRVEKKFGETQIQNPTVEMADTDDPLHTGRIVPVYRSTEKLNARALRRLIRDNLDRWGSYWPNWVPAELMEKYELVLSSTALRHIHFPNDDAELKQARRYLIFEELLMLQLLVQEKKLHYKEQHEGIPHCSGRNMVDDFLALLPFSLTGAQQRVLADILADMESREPMNRLLQGDVGSGKTMVAAAALVQTVASGHQGALMAPTEILAEQHYSKLEPYFQQLGIHVRLLTGRMNGKEKNNVLNALKQGDVQIVIGTHALIQDGVSFQALGLAVTDEQHRFGVSQREDLHSKGKSPDVLVMSATPIPRTLTLTVFGDLDVSVIDSLPPGRQPVETYWVDTALRARVYRFIREQARQGRQAYVVCPLVEESEKLQAEAAVEMAVRLQRDEFPDLEVELLHGRMKSDEKEAVMDRFRSGTVHVLVATTVIEVGVDVPNAVVMVVEGADRFGLAQLHQLRGRVGRGEHASYCILVAEPGSEDGEARLNALCRSQDGFRIAEEDLKLRGPGEYLGTRQSGLTNLKIADLVRDAKVMEVARQDAQKLLSDRGLSSSSLLPSVQQEWAYRFDADETGLSLA